MIYFILQSTTPHVIQSILTIIIHYGDSSHGWRNGSDVGWACEATNNGFTLLFESILCSKNRDTLYSICYSSLEGYGLRGKAEVTGLCIISRTKITLWKYFLVFEFFLHYKNTASAYLQFLQHTGLFSECSQMESPPTVPQH